MTFRTRSARILAAAALVGGLLGSTALSPAPVAAAGGTLYVDGKIGKDTNPGTSATTPFKTIAKAAATIPRGSAAAGWTVVVQGYKDYIYRERPIPQGWDGRGTSSAPVVFQAAGYVASRSTYVKPIVSGSDLAPKSGYRWEATSTAGVWRTYWDVKPFSWGSGYGPLTNVIFQDGTTWLWAQRSLADLGAAAAKGQGGFWWDATNKYIYVSAVSATGPSGANPTGHTIDVIVRNAFYFNGQYGVRYVQVRGFQVEHSANGIAFAMGTDYGTAADNVSTANLWMGIQTVGYQTSAGADPSVGNYVWRNTGSYNTVQFIKADEGTVDSSFCYNTATRNGLQGIKLQGPPVGSNYTGKTSGNTISYNKLSDQNYNPTGSTYNNANGLMIGNGAINTTAKYNDAWNNDVGIMVSQESGARPAVENTKLLYNRMWNNRRFGLYFFDGYYGSGSGYAISYRDLMWGNGMGVMVDRGSTRKTLDHDTIYGNRTDGVKVGGTNVAKASVTITHSIVSNNGEYGLWLVTGNSATVSYTAFYANASKAVYGGAPSISGVNYSPPGYLSTSSSDPAFLQIGTASYQYTAGANKTPIGARY